MKRIILSFILVFLMASCEPVQPVEISTKTLSPSNTPVPSSTPQPSQVLFPTHTPTTSLTPWPTSTPSLTSTPQPTLAAHQWKPEPVLVSYDTRGGFCDIPCTTWPSPFILYGDGTLVVGKTIELNGEYQYRYLYKKLSRNDTCRLLNTIDQFGFLDFDPKSYAVEGVYDALMWDIDVSLWRKNKISLYALGDLASELKHFGKIPAGVEAKIPPSVLNTYILLSDYPLDGFVEYTEPLGVWVWKPSDNYQSKAWGVYNISLAELYQRAGSPMDKLPNPIILNGKDARDVYTAFNNSVYYGAMTEGDEAYQIYVRPILPFEKIEDEMSTISPTANQLGLPDEMQCTPSDGVMAIPTFEAK
jgi:hypothetical protein